jgi:hypothetical protein
VKAEVTGIDLAVSNLPQVSFDLFDVANERFAQPMTGKGIKFSIPMALDKYIEAHASAPAA